MRPVSVVAQNGVNSGNSPTVPLDYMLTPFNVGLGMVIGSTPTFKVQYTFDNVLDSTVTPTWFDVTGLTALAANKDAVITTPCRAVRAVVTGGTGTVTMTVVQAGVR